MPDGVVFSFQVCLYSIEPTVSNRAFNLLTKDAVRATLADEPVKLGPEMPLVGLAFLLPRRAKGLARAGTSPDPSIAGPSGEIEGETPSADSSEEMALSESSKVGWLNFRDASFIDFPLRYQPVRDEFAEPGSGVFVELVVIVQATSNSFPACHWALASPTPAR
jgi:hypothetical protein